MYYSPLRYPGGKRKLANFFKLVFRLNDLVGGEYAEPYAGGAAVALALLLDDFVQRIYINDIDRGIHAFWTAVLFYTDELCQRIFDVHIDMQEWEHQRAVLQSNEPDMSDLAFSTFFLNRTNRSGIITGGVIGGKKQNGEWKLDARFNKEDLVKRIERIAQYGNRIELTNLDASSFIDQVANQLQERSLIYMDPPYYEKGSSQLYENFYQDRDHETIAQQVSQIKQRWVVSYDNVGPIRRLYQDYRKLEYGISYSTQCRYRGKEVMFFSDNLIIPDVANPSSIRAEQYRRMEAELI